MHPLTFKVKLNITRNQFSPFMWQLPHLLRGDHTSRASLHAMNVKKVSKGIGHFEFRIGEKGHGMRVEAEITREHDGLCLKVIDTNGQVRKKFNQLTGRTAETEIGNWLTTALTQFLEQPEQREKKGEEVTTDMATATA
jgi:hypothetical protein